MTAIEMFDSDPDVGITGLIMANTCPMATREVRLAIANYAQGNRGVAKALSTIVATKKIRTSRELEAEVGWPVADHTKEKVGAIWDKFKT